MSESTTKEPFVRTMSPVPRPRLPPRLAAGARTHGLAPGELVKLHHTLAEALETSRGVITQFVAPEPDAGIEAVVYDLAYISAAWLGERVLFINGTSMRFDANDRTTPGRNEPLLTAPTGLGDIESSITRVVGLELYQMTFHSMR